MSKQKKKKLIINKKFELKKSELEDLIEQLLIRFEERKNKVDMSQDEKDLIDFMCGKKNNNGQKEFMDIIKS